MGVFVLAIHHPGTVSMQLRGVHMFVASVLWQLQVEAGKRIHPLGGISPIALFSSGPWKLEPCLAVGGRHDHVAVVIWEGPASSDSYSLLEQGQGVIQFDASVFLHELPRILAIVLRGGYTVCVGLDCEQQCNKDRRSGLGFP